MILSAILVVLLTPLLILLLQIVQKMASVNQRASLAQGEAAVESRISFRSGGAALWLVPLLATMIAWLLILLSRPDAAYTIPLITWRPVTYFPDTLRLLIDPVSWSFALALTTLVLGVILTAPIRTQNLNWRTWAGSLALVGFGLLAVMSGNPLTLLLSWAAIDILEIIIYLSQGQDSKIHIQSLVTFATRISGLGLLLWADIAAASAGEALSFTNVPSRLNILLLISSGLRLGVLPFHLPYLQGPPTSRGLGTTLRLVPAAASLVLLTRTAAVPLPPAWKPYLLGLVGISALYGAFHWIFAQDELQGRPYWVLAMASLSIASAVCGVPEATLCWGLACIFSGGLIFLYSPQQRKLQPLILFSFICLSGLPFTPTWGGIRLYLALPSLWFLPIFILANVLLLSGYALHGLRMVATPGKTQSWVWVFYTLGLTLFPGSFIVWFWQASSWQGFFSTLITPRSYPQISLLMWLVGAAVVGLALLSIWLKSRLKPEKFPSLSRKSTIISFGQGFFSLGWFYEGISRFLRGGMWMARLVSGILEGDAGILWVMVILVLVLALLMSGGQL